MNEIKFDEPRIEEMQNFLMYLYNIGKDNKNFEVTSSFVYRELRKYELGDDDRGLDGDGIFCRDMFKDWQKRNRDIESSKKGLELRHDTSWIHFLEFYSKADYSSMYQEYRFIKLYLPFKNKDLFNAVNVLFDYITDSKIKHASKVADRIRSDNVIVRLGHSDISSALKIIDFVNNNEVIKNNLNKTNPFVPTIKGIGFMYESGISYNDDISHQISDYINECLLKRKPPVLSEFHLWIQKSNVSVEVLSIFSYAIGEKKSIKYTEKLLEQEKYQLLVDALKVTFLKYGFSQAVTALKGLLDKNNYSYFTNGDGEIKYRNELMKNVTKEDANRYLKLYMMKNRRYGEYISSYLENEDESLLIYFCANLLKDELLKDFTEACCITYLNYDDIQLKQALKNTIENGDSSRFSRYSKYDTNHTKNYRELMKKYGKSGVYRLMKLALDCNGIQYDKDNIDEMISLFTDKIISLSNENNEDKKNSR